MVGFVMNKDSAIRICNSVYSIMLGFTVNNMLLADKVWTNYSASLSPIAAIIIAYYIIDWFSFNALATIDKTQESIEIFFAIAFVIFLGWLMVFANNVSLLNINSFTFYSSIYLLVSTILSFLRMYVTMQEKWKIELDKDKFVLIDIIIRILFGIIGLACSANKLKEPVTSFSAFNGVIIIFASVILLIKIIRYWDLVKIIKEKEKQQ